MRGVFGQLRNGGHHGLGGDQLASPQGSVDGPSKRVVHLAVSPHGVLLRETRQNHDVQRLCQRIVDDVVRHWSGARLGFVVVWWVGSCVGSVRDRERGRRRGLGLGQNRDGTRGAVQLDDCRGVPVGEKVVEDGLRTCFVEQESIARSGDGLAERDQGLDARSVEGGIGPQLILGVPQEIVVDEGDGQIGGRGEGVGAGVERDLVHVGDGGSRLGRRWLLRLGHFLILLGGWTALGREKGNDLDIVLRGERRRVLEKGRVRHVLCRGRSPPLLGLSQHGKRARFYTLSRESTAY